MTAHAVCMCKILTQIRSKRQRFPLMPSPEVVGVPKPRIEGQHFGVRRQRARIDGAGQLQPLQGPHAAAAPAHSACSASSSFEAHIERCKGT